MTIPEQTIERVPVAELRQHPQNPRQGDVGAIHESIKSNGWYGALIVQRSTNTVLAGNHRLQAAVAAGIDALDVIYLDVDDDRALRILLADNRTNDLASYDQAALADLLRETLETTGSLSGTGFDDDAFDDLLKDLQTPDYGDKNKEINPDDRQDLNRRINERVNPRKSASRL